MGEIRMTRDFFLWCMSVIYLFAFSSLFVQIPGLYGDNGILPAKLVLQKEAVSFPDLVLTQPTLMRLLPKLGLDTQASLDLLCLGGIVLAFVAMISKAQRNCFVFGFLWVFYFSVFQVGQTFLWFQWDILLLEAGFLSILVAPMVFPLIGRVVPYHQHDRLTMWLVKWLLFRLMFASGVVKLTSNCPTWWKLTALNYHYETQCIPTPAAWVFHHLPEWFNKLSVASVYVIEIALPFLFFSPVRSQRIFAFYSQVLFMGLIMMTGNYNFFNLLTVALCVTLVDDNWIRSWIGKRPLGNDEDATKIPIVNKFWRPIKWLLNLLVYGAMIYWSVKLFSLSPKTKPMRVESKIAFSQRDFTHFLEKVVPVSIWVGVIGLGVEIAKAILRSIVYERGMLRKVRNLVGCAVFGAAAIGMFSISLVDHTVVEKKSQSALWPVLHDWHGTVKRFEISSSYGLFRSMTGVGGRPEVIIEGSNQPDRGWKEYNFLYKPGNVSDKLPIVAPHQPRLDWQMWFAALGNYQHNPWFLNLVYRLLTQQKEVLDLMGENPFPDKPPKYIRATLYHYYYTSMNRTHETFSATDWWTRKRVREYLPVITKEEPSFTNYLKSAGLMEESGRGGNPGHDGGNPGYEHVNFLQYALTLLRVGTARFMDGYYVCVGLFVTGCILGYLDPTIKLLKEHSPLK